jgi:hypothetical protein
MSTRGRQHWQVASATGRLMDALSQALDSDAASVPAPVRRAALNLARELQSSLPSSPDSRVDFWSRDGTSGARAMKTREVPFCESIRLGRMG